MNMKQIFDKFLSDNGIYRAYNANVRGLQIKDPYLYISDAFIRDHTTEGYSFWLVINDRWRKVVLAEESKSQIKKKKPKPKGTGYCDECGENISFFNIFKIKYCPMCGSKLTNY